MAKGDHHPRPGNYLDIDGRWRRCPPHEQSACAGCGMPCHPAEYHPWAACELFKVHRDARTVRGNLYAVLTFGRQSEAP